MRVQFDGEALVGQDARAAWKGGYATPGSLLIRSLTLRGDQAQGHGRDGKDAQNRTGDLGRLLSARRSASRRRRSRDSRTGNRASARERSSSSPGSEGPAVSVVQDREGVAEVEATQRITCMPRSSVPARCPPGRRLNRSTDFSKRSGCGAPAGRMREEKRPERGPDHGRAKRGGSRVRQE